MDKTLSKSDTRIKRKKSELSWILFLFVVIFVWYSFYFDCHLTITDADCRKIYYCKSYLQVKWLSDILSADSQFVPKGIYYGYQMITQLSSKLEEVVQERPNEQSWRIWRKFLRKHVCNEELESTITLFGWHVDMNDYERLLPFY